jgi:hypothetical protein
MDFPAGHGEAEGTRLLGQLAGSDATARHIARKLSVRFVSDDPPPSIVDRVAESLSTSRGDIRAALKTLLLSSEFLAAKDTKLKRPFEFVVSALRATRPGIRRSGYRELYETLRRLGQVPYGWPTPDGYPDTAFHWISTSALLARANFALGLADGTLVRFFDLRIPTSLVPETPAGIVDRLSAHILGRALTAEDRLDLIAFAADGRDPAQRMGGSARIRAARGVLGLLLVSRYFQLR